MEIFENAETSWVVIPKSTMILTCGVLKMNQASTWKPVVKRLEPGERDRLKRAKACFATGITTRRWLNSVRFWKNPRSISGLLGAGLVCLKREQFTEALSRFRQAKDIDLYNPSRICLRGSRCAVWKTWRKASTLLMRPCRWTPVRIAP